MDYQLDGRFAFVAAGAHGIGRATADLLAAEGASVLVADRDNDALRANGGAWRGTVAADLSTADGVDAAVDYVLQTFGRPPDILINNLGVGDSTPFEDITDERWMASFNVNLMGTVRLCRALVPTHGDARVGRRRQHRLGSREAARTRVRRLRLVQGRAAVPDEGARASSTHHGAGQHRAAGPDLVAHVDAARRHRGPAGRALRH